MLNSQMIQRRRESIYRRKATRARAGRMLKIAFNTISGFIAFRCFDLISKSDLSLLSNVSITTVCINLFPIAIITLCAMRIIKLFKLV